MINAINLAQQPLLQPSMQQLQQKKFPQDKNEATSFGSFSSNAITRNLFSVIGVICTATAAFGG